MASKIDSISHEDENTLLSAVVFLVRFDEEDSPKSDTVSEEDEFESYASVPLSVNIFCGKVSRLKAYFDDDSTQSETDMVDLGMFNLLDEVVIELRQENKDCNDGKILERVSIPIICFDRSKLSDLTLEEAGVTVTVSFTFTAICSSEPIIKEEDISLLPIPIAAPEEPLNPILEESFSDETKSVDGDEDSSSGEQQQEEEAVKQEPLPMVIVHDYHNSSSSTASSKLNTSTTSSRVYSRSQWTIRVSDMYKFLKVVIVAVAHSRETITEMIHILRSTISYLTDSSKLVLSLCIDLSLDAIRQFDTVFSEALLMLDEGVNHLKDLLFDYLQLIINKVRSQFPWMTNAALGLVMYSAKKARPWIKATIRCSRPIIQPAIMISSFSWPYLITPTAAQKVTQKVSIAQARLEKYPFATKVIHVSKKVTAVVAKEVYDMYNNDDDDNKKAV